MVEAWHCCTWGWYSRSGCRKGGLRIHVCHFDGMLACQWDRCNAEGCTSDLESGGDSLSNYDYRNCKRWSGQHNHCGRTSSAGTPLDFGAGFIQPEKAMHPGLIYDTNPDDYFQFLCALSYDTPQMQKFIHGPFTCPPRLLIEHLNLPSFTTVFNNRTITNKTPVRFIRLVTNAASSKEFTLFRWSIPRDFQFQSSPPHSTFLYSRWQGLKSLWHRLKPQISKWFMAA